MKRLLVLISVIVAASGGVVGWSAPVSAAHSIDGRFTLQIKFDATRVVVGTMISGTVIVRNETNRSLSYTTCPEDWVVAGLVGHGATFTPVIATDLCYSKRVFKPHSTVTFPISVETTYDGCGHSGVPACPRNGIPLLPLGRYKVDIVNTGLPQSITVLPTSKVTLVNATTGKSVGPIGGSILIQAYGCETVSYPQPPIAVVLDKGGRVIARRNKLGLTQVLIVGVSPGFYQIRSNVRPVHPVRVVNGVQAVATVIPHCN
jgi:hypothetical protein